MRSSDTTPTRHVVQRVVEELVLVNLISIYDEIVTKVLERNRIHVRMVVGHDLSPRRPEVKVQATKTSLNRTDKVGTFLESVNVRAVKGGDGVLGAVHGAGDADLETVLDEGLDGAQDVYAEGVHARVGYNGEKDR